MIYNGISIRFVRVQSDKARFVDNYMRKRYILLILKCNEDLGGFWSGVVLIYIYKSCAQIVEGNFSHNTSTM